MDENKNGNVEEKDVQPVNENETELEKEYDPASYYEKEDVYDFIEDSEEIKEKKRRAKKNRGAKIAAAVIAAILIATGAAAKVMLGKIGDAKLRQSGKPEDGEPSAVTELDDSEQSEEEPAGTAAETPSAATDTSSADDGLPETVLPGAENQKKYASHAADLSDLQSELTDMIKYYPGSWSVYVEELKTGESIYMNNEPMYAASLIKLFAMGAAYQRISEERLNEGYAYDYIYGMITESSNNAFDTVVDLMGDGYLSEWLMQNGFWDTTYVHGLGDGVVYEGKRSPDGDNFTTTKDVGKLLSKIYRGELVNKYYSEEMLKILKDQTKTEKIPAGLPEGTVYGNKTGETDNVCHDSAIVYSDGGDYIIVVMAKDPNEAWVCDPFITDISRAVYEYFNTLAEEDVPGDSRAGISAEEYYDDETDLGEDELDEYPDEDEDIVYDDEDEDIVYED